MKRSTRAGWRVAVLGATGAVGRTMLSRLETSDLAVADLVPLASPRSEGGELPFRGEARRVRAVAEERFDGVDLVLASAGAAASGIWAPVACARGAGFIDNSSRWRMEAEVPLIVPEVNADVLPPRRRPRPHGATQGSLIANPNCSTIQLVVALEPIRRRFGLRRVFVATYQSASGVGQKGLDALEEERRGNAGGAIFPGRLLGNVLPQVDIFLEDGWTREEEKTLRETRKILRLPDLPVHPTCARVPVEVGHSEAVYVETEEPVRLQEARAAFASAPGLVLAEEDGRPGFRAAREAAGTDPVWVGRVRADRSDPRGLHFWVVADNLRKGAATNAVQIAELWWTRENG